MKSRALVLSMAVVVLLSALPAAGAVPITTQSKLATALGIRYENPTAQLNIGQKANAIVVNQAKLAGHQLAVKNNDKLEMTLNHNRTFSLVHVKSGRTLRFSYGDDNNPALTLLR